MIRVLAFGFAAVLLIVAKSVHASPLEAYHWKARPVIVFGAADSDVFRKQLELFNRASDAFRERDIVLIPVSNESGPQGLRTAYRVAPGEFEVLLAGKDGGVKLRSRKIVQPGDIFGLVDAMPMRRQEMGRR